MVVAFVIRGLKEFDEPARKALIMGLVPEGQSIESFGYHGGLGQKYCAFQTKLLCFSDKDTVLFGQKVG